ncbi:MAG: DUF5047 domain-containing protein, partial [Actinomycetota bacterium]|nr:DUF5047 domain-containing protein [Actinomycetota bacterium]
MAGDRLMWTLSTPARTALIESHATDLRATVFSPTLGAREVGLSDGEVVADSRSQVRRTATVVADPRLWPASPIDLLAPYGSEMIIEYGIVLRNGSTQWVPLGRFRLNDVERERPRTDGLTVQLVDRSAAVADDRLDAPIQTVAGALTVTEIRRLITEALPDVTVLDRTGSTQIAAVLEIQRDRWADGVEKLSDALAAETFFDPVGVGVIRPQPTLADAEAWELTTGARGTIIT